MEEFVSQPSELLLRAVHRGRFLSRWSSLLFEDDSGVRPVGQWVRAARAVEHLTDSDLDRLLDGTSECGAGSYTADDGSSGLRPRIAGSWSETYWPQGWRGRVGHGLQLCLCEVVIALLRWPPSAYLLSRLLRWRLVVFGLKAVITGRLLQLLLRHRGARRGLLVFLRTPRVAQGLVNVLHLDAALVELCRDQDTPELLKSSVLGRRGMGSFLRRFVVAVPPDLVSRFLQHKATAKAVAQVVLLTEAEASAAWVHRRRRQLPEAIARSCKVPGAELWAARSTFRLEIFNIFQRFWAKVLAEAMNFCATEGIDRWLGEVLNDPRGAGFAKRLLLQEGFLVPWTWEIHAFLSIPTDFIRFLCFMKGHEATTRLKSIEDKVADFLSLAEARRFVIRLLRQPGVYRFVTCLEDDF